MLIKIAPSVGNRNVSFSKFRSGIKGAAFITKEPLGFLWVKRLASIVILYASQIAFSSVFIIIFYSI